MQNKIGSIRQWNFHQLTLLEYRERNLETWLMEFMDKKDELKAKAKDKAETILKLEGTGHLGPIYLQFPLIIPTSIPT